MRIKSTVVGQTGTGWNTSVISGGTKKPYNIKRLASKNFKRRVDAVKSAKSLSKKYKTGKVWYS